MGGGRGGEGGSRKSRGDAGLGEGEYELEKRLKMRGGGTDGWRVENRRGIEKKGGVSWVGFESWTSWMGEVRGERRGCCWWVEGGAEYEVFGYGIGCGGERGKMGVD